MIPLPPINNVQACFDTVTHCALSLKRTPDPDALSNLDGLRADLLPAYEQLRGVQRAEYAVAIWRYCLHRGLYNEGLRMLLDSGAAFMKYPWPLRLEACIAMGVLYRRIAMFTEAHNYLHQAWRIVQVVEVPCDKAFIQQQFAQIAIELGQFDKAVEYLEVSRNFACKDNDQWMLGVIAQQRATIHLQCQELNEANVLFLQALNLFTAIGEHRRALDAQINRALVAAEMGYYEVAENTYRTCLNICRKLNDPWMLALCFHNLGDACIQTQKYEEAQTNLNLAYHQMKNLGRMSMLPVVLRALAGVYFKTNDYPNALRLYSFVEHVQAQANMTPTLYERRQMNEALAVIRLKMRANTIKTYQNQGKRLTQQMVERLLNL